MTLEDCIAEVAQTGATGIQLIPEQMMPGYPTPSPALVDRWHAAVARHGLTPTLMDTFVDVSCGGPRTLSLEEGVQQLVEQMRLAKQLGFSIIRPTTGPVIESAPELIRAALPYAEELDVRIAPEIHAPIPLDGPYIDSYLELIAKSGTRHLGFTLDLGVFCKRIPPAAIAMVLRKGGQPEIIAYLERAFAEKLSGDAARAGMQAMHPNDVTRDFGFHYGAFGPSTNQVAHLPRIIPHIMNVHGKFYEVTESGVEESIDTIDVVAALASGGYTGSIDSEYEGQRLTQDAFPTDSCEQVRRHQLLLRRGLQAVS
jgi:sugar phosphate isomerase/epimerase